MKKSEKNTVVTQGLCCKAFTNQQTPVFPGKNAIACYRTVFHRGYFLDFSSTCGIMYFADALKKPFGASIPLAHDARILRSLAALSN